MKLLMIFLASAGLWTAGGGQFVQNTLSQMPQAAQARAITLPGGLALPDFSGLSLPSMPNFNHTASVSKLDADNIWTRSAPRSDHFYPFEIRTIEAPTFHQNATTPDCLVGRTFTPLSCGTRS